MKKSIFSTILLFLVFSFSFLSNTHGQDCPLPQASKVLQGNNISANILNGGDLFWDRSNASFSTQEGSNPPAHSIFAAGIWIGGFTGAFTNNPNLKLSASTYPNETSNDYSTGPLFQFGPPDIEMCTNFDRLWEVTRSEVEAHIADFEDDGLVNNKQENIYAYPGHQNPFFFDFNNFVLPNSSHGLAPFFDQDADGIYNPDNGDFPLPSPVNKNNIPEHMIWGIFNDNGNNHTASQGDIVQAEIQLTVWAFSCTNNQVIDNTIFTSHKIINKAASRIDSLHIGMFVDFDLGCFTDDYVGCIPDMNTFYAYNSDENDGENGDCTGGVSTYADNPPVQAVTYLNHKMDYFTTTQPAQNSSLGNSNLPSGFYNLLTGSWTDGTPLTQGGDGLTPGGTPTSFLFDDNPNDPMGWSMHTENILNGDFRTVSSIDIDSLLSQQTTTIDMAYTFYQDEDLNNIETVNMVYENTPTIQLWYDNQFQAGCDAITSVENNILKENLIQLFPNPTTHLLNVKLENPQAVAFDVFDVFDVFDIYGKKVFKQAESFNSDFQLPIEHLSEGVYFLKIKIDGEEKFNVRKTGKKK